MGATLTVAYASTNKPRSIHTSLYAIRSQDQSDHTPGTATCDNNTFNPIFQLTYNYVIWKKLLVLLPENKVLHDYLDTV